MARKDIRIAQAKYGDIVVEATEKDVVQIWSRGEVVLIENENLSKVIEVLKAENEIRNG